MWPPTVEVVWWFGNAWACEPRSHLSLAMHRLLLEAQLVAFATELGSACASGSPFHLTSAICALPDECSCLHMGFCVTLTTLLSNA